MKVTVTPSARVIRPPETRQLPEQQARPRRYASGKNGAGTRVARRCNMCSSEAYGGGGLTDGRFKAGHSASVRQGDGR